DPVLRIELWNLFHSLAAQGKTLLVSSHVMDEADRCDSLILLRDGEILAQGSPSELKAQTGEDEMEAVFISLVSAR
ncbi:MAG: ABC transporter ATP-binding protein, partial [Actinobacteria bacterium]|nr:ABC transporter ATP-binding protein [Actinomycetota bacterium]